MKDHNSQEEPVTTMTHEERVAELLESLRDEGIPETVTAWEASHICQSFGMEPGQFVTKENADCDEVIPLTAIANHVVTCGADR